MEDRLFTIFEEFCAIPRESGNEGGISQYLIEFARKHGLKYMSDEHFNVIIEKSAADGKQMHRKLFLQAHTDMVCEKTADSVHDFKNDGISICREGDYLMAKDTSLGADNGIGVAMILKLLEDDFANPEIIGVFTADEERGLAGVKNLDISQYRDVHTLINIDSEEEGVFISSCAGGVRCRIEASVSVKEFKPSADDIIFSVSVKGLNGGHSGIMIDREYANAIILLAEIISTITNTMRIKLLNISGGGKENSIPASASADICIKAEKGRELNELVEKLSNKMTYENQTSESGLEISCAKIDKDYNSYIDAEDTKRVMDLIAVIPNGLITRDLDANCTIASSNLGIVKIGNCESQRLTPQK